MPFHFEYDPSHRILLVVAEGEFDDADQLAIVDAIRAHASTLDVAAGIGDYTQVTGYTASPRAVYAAARMPSPYAPGIPRFMVAPHDHVFGLSMVYKAIGDETRSAVRVVRSREEALEALGVREAAFERVGAT